MDSRQFDAIVRDRLSMIVPRSTVVAASATALLAWFGGSSDRPVTAAAQRKKPLQRNRYRCVPVGKPCRGKDGACCSGICRGKKPKKGEKDQSRCMAHDAGGCVGGQHPGICGGEDAACMTSNHEAGWCSTTTGNAGYCFRAISIDPMPCRRDADCQKDRAGAACIRCPSSGGTRCVAF
jgi:hypothetical protein